MLKEEWLDPKHPLQPLADYIYRNPDNLPAIALDSLIKIADSMSNPTSNT